jgi:transcriptional regulator with XRE-family HTH domain
MTIGNRIKDERERLKMNQEEFALQGGVSLRSQQMYERDKTDPAAGYFVSISKIGVDVNYILTGVRIPIVQSSTAKTKGIEILEDVKKPPTKVVARNLGELGVSEDDLSLARMINRLPEAQKNTKIADIETLLRSNYEAIQDWLARDGNMQKVA